MTNAETQAALTRFYEAFARRDGETMAALYATEATFEDPVFSLTGSDIGKMWVGLLAGAKDFSVAVHRGEGRRRHGRRGVDGPLSLRRQEARRERDRVGNRDAGRTDRAPEGHIRLSALGSAGPRASGSPLRADGAGCGAPSRRAGPPGSACPRSPENPRRRDFVREDSREGPGAHADGLEEPGEGNDPLLRRRRSARHVGRGLPAGDQGLPGRPRRRDRRREAPMEKGRAEDERGRLRPREAARAAPPPRLRPRTAAHSSRLPRELRRRLLLRPGLLGLFRAFRVGPRARLPARDGARRQAALQGRARHGARPSGAARAARPSGDRRLRARGVQPHREHGRGRPLRIRAARGRAPRGPLRRRVGPRNGGGTRHGGHARDLPHAASRRSVARRDDRVAEPRPLPRRGTPARSSPASTRSSSRVAP